MRNARYSSYLNRSTAHCFFLRRFFGFGSPPSVGSGAEDAPPSPPPATPPPPPPPALMMKQMVHLKMFTMRITNDAAKYQMCRDRD